MASLDIPNSTVRTVAKTFDQLVPLIHLEQLIEDFKGVVGRWRRLSSELWCLLLHESCQRGWDCVRVSWILSRLVTMVPIMEIIPLDEYYPYDNDIHWFENLEISQYQCTIHISVHYLFIMSFHR